MYNELDYKEREISDAKSDLSQINAMLELIKNNELACEIHMCGLKIGLCNNSKVIPAIEYHKNEIIKYLNNEPNEWV